MLSTPAAQPKVTAPISLLRLIAEDKDFRAKVEADPVAAFAEHGVDLPNGTPCKKLPEQFWDDVDGGNKQMNWLGLL